MVSSLERSLARSQALRHASLKKFNYRITWAVDGGKGPSKLAAESYAHGSDARYNSWVILKRV